MKTANIFTIVMCIASFFVLSTSVLANELDSTNYKLIGVTTTGGGGLGDSDNYSLLTSTGNISADPRIYSTNYRLNQDPSANFVAAQPGIQCFETDTDGTTACTSGPAELLSGGMVAICGTGGCYDKARFELNPYTNPADTLYSIQISTDNFVDDASCIDGSIFRPKSLSTCNINDFRTEAYWEDETFNVKGLQSNTQYYVRITALHGDFTQSDLSTVSNATTAPGSIEFDIDIAISSGITTETGAPYTISFSDTEKLIAGAAATTSSNLIWLDVLSSSSGGIAVIQFGKYGGLYSPTTSQTILSTNQNLDDALSEGFGLQSYYIDYDDSSPYYGDLSSTANYSGTINTVGEVSTSGKKIYEGDGPIVAGRMGIYLKAKAGVGKNPATDYTEEIAFVLVPLY
ncbi:MAG: hypothetical protein AB9915_03975 [Candidatus Dojkabacteria bacterium]